MLGAKTLDAIAALRAVAARQGRNEREGIEKRAHFMTREMREARKEAFHVPTMMNLVEWTETYRSFGDLHNAAGSTVRISELEVTRGPFLWVTEQGPRRIFIMACTQSGKTFWMESIAGRAMHLDPGPIVYVAPTIQNAIDWIDEKFMKMVAATKVLRPLINTSRTSGNRNDYKRFPGGRLRGIGTETRVGFTQKGDRYMLVDEIDGHGTAGENGDTIELIAGRNGDYQYNYLLAAASSPVTKRRFAGEHELPTIWKLVQDSDRRLPFVQCPHCGHDHFMEWHREGKAKESLEIPKRDERDRGTFEPEKAFYVCPGNGCVITQRDREKMLRQGAVHWRACMPFTCCDLHQDPRARWEASDQTQADYGRWWQPFGEDLGVPPIGYGTKGVCRAKCEICGTMPVSNAIVGGHYSRYYRPQYTLAEMARDWVGVIRDPAKRRAFRNTILGLPDEDQHAKRVTADQLAELGEEWEAKPDTGLDGRVEYLVPDQVAVITMGIDIQTGSEDGTGSRFAFERVGWSEDEQSWSLDYNELPANTRTKEGWDKVLLPEIKRRLHRADGRVFQPTAVCIDAGNRPDDAGAFVARHQVQLAQMGIHLFAVKGIGDKGSTTYRTWAGAAVDAKSFRKHAGQGVKLWNVGVREAKDTIADHLATRSGPGTMHFPADRGEHWTQGMLSETQVPRNGRLVWEWIDRSVRNEPIDCRVYALAALRAMESIFAASGWSLSLIARHVGASRPSMPTAADAAQHARQVEASAAAREDSASVSSSPTPPKPVAPKVPLKPKRRKRSSYWD